MNAHSAATQPTLYFIGVTTAQSSIMKVFPAWASHLGLGNSVIRGIDFHLHAPASTYRDVVEFIKHDPLSVGALVTTHKIDLYKAAHDLFDVLDPHAKFMGETSCLSKRDGKLVCHAKDPISSGLAIDGFLPPHHFAKTGAEVFSIGAGGSTIALTWHLMQHNRGDNRPSRIVVSNRSAGRLNDIRSIHRAMNASVRVDYVLAPNPADNDAVVAQLKPGSLVINATGLGKDAPGSPLTDVVSFPQNAIVWDLNYRGNLEFLNQARAQHQAKSMQIEDGWTYFIHGWTQVIAEVFNVAIPMTGPNFDILSRIAIESAK
jgi:shikimate 5-dehydrogenase